MEQLARQLPGATACPGTHRVDETASGKYRAPDPRTHEKWRVVLFAAMRGWREATAPRHKAFLLVHGPYRNG